MQKCKLENFLYISHLILRPPSRHATQGSCMILCTGALSTVALTKASVNSGSAHASPGALAFFPKSLQIPGGGDKYLSQIPLGWVQTPRTRAYPDTESTAHSSRFSWMFQSCYHSQLL